MYADPRSLLPRDGHAELTGAHMHAVECSSCMMLVRPFVPRLVTVVEAEPKGSAGQAGAAPKKKGQACAHTHIGCVSSATLIELLTHYGANSMEGVPGFKKAPNRPFIARSLEPLVMHQKFKIEKMEVVKEKLKMPSAKKEPKQAEKKEPKQVEKKEPKPGETHSRSATSFAPIAAHSCLLLIGLVVLLWLVSYQRRRSKPNTRAERRPR